MTVEPLSERLLDMHHRRVDRWSHADQDTVGQAIWALRSLQAIADAWKGGDSVPLSYRAEKRFLRDEWPELAVLLDALTEENKT